MKLLTTLFSFSLKNIYSPTLLLECTLFSLENYPEFSRFFLCGQRYRLEDTKIGDDVINNERKVAEFLNNVYMNVVENTAGKKPLSVLEKNNVTFSKAINTILEKYKYHPNLLNIIKHSEQTKCCSFPEVTTTDVLKLIKCIDINKAMGEDQIPPKQIKTVGNFLVEAHTNIINSYFRTSISPNLAKRVSVTPFDNGILISIFTQTTDLSVFRILFPK